MPRSKVALLGYLLHVFLALLTLGFADGELATETPHPFWICALLVVPHGLAILIRRVGRSGRFRAMNALGFLLEHAAPLLFFITVLACGWQVFLRERFDLEAGLLDWPGLGLLVGLLPYGLFELVSIDARARLATSSAASRAQHSAFERRMFASSAAPIVLFVFLAALVGANDRFRIALEEISLLNTAFTILTMALFLFALPLVLRRTWSTTPLGPGGIRQMLELVAQRAGFEYHDLFVWNTGHRMANAAIVGLARRQRYVLFSDALLVELSPREIAAVFAHEIGHAVRRHMPFFLLTLACVFFAIQLVLRVVPTGDLLVEMSVLGGLIVLWAMGFSFLSRRFELEADLVSMEILGDPAPLASALSHVTAAHAHERNSWRHFSTSRRIAFLERVALDPSVGQRLTAKLQRARRVFAIVCLVAVLGEAYFLFQDLPEERAIVALRLGDYSKASEVLPEDADEGLRRLVERTTAFGEREVGAEELESRALEALRDGDVEATEDFVQLAFLLGADHLSAVGRTLVRLEEGADEALDEDLPQAWREAFEGLERPESDDSSLESP